MPEYWTTEYPKEPGAYWLRNYRFKSSIRGEDKIKPGPRLVDVNAPYSDIYYFGVETPEHRELLICGEWLGPIQPPQEKPTHFPGCYDILEPKPVEWDTAAGEVGKAVIFNPDILPPAKAASLTELFHNSLTNRGKTVLANQALDDLEQEVCGRCGRYHCQDDERGEEK